MQAIALHPQRKQLNGMMMGIVLLAIGMFLFPALCMPLGLALPLFACPLFGTKWQWASFAAVILAPSCALVYGYPPMYAACLVLCCGAPVLAAVLLHPVKAATPVAYVYYFIAYGLAVTVALAYLGSGGRGELAAVAADLVCSRVESSSTRNMTLYRLAAAGLLPMSDGYLKRSVALNLMDPVLMNQLMLSLHLLVQSTARQLLPTLVVQTCLLGGVFTTLRVQRMNHSYLLVDADHKEQVKLAVTPGFSMLRLSKQNWGCLMVIALAAVLTSGARDGVEQQLSLVLYAAFSAAVQLYGASVLMGLLLKRRPENKALYASLTVLLYLVFPAALILLGIMDPLLHLRNSDEDRSKEENKR